jgi:transcriptional regulator with XRE-family HTH domain
MNDEVAVSSDPGFGSRVSAVRRARGMSREAVAALCGRSEEWLRKIERGQRGTSLKMVARLAEVLRVADLSELLDSEAPTALYTRPTHVELAPVRTAILSAVPHDTEPPSIDQVRANLDATWRLRSASGRDRSDLATVLPGLIIQARQVVKWAENPEDRRHGWRVLAEVYHLAQLYLCYQDSSELLWVVVDRAANAAQESEDAATLGRAAWFSSYLYRDAGMVDQAHQVVDDALRHLDAVAEKTPHIQRQRRVVHLAAAWNHAREGRPAQAWRSWDAATDAEHQGGAPVSPHTLFGAECADIALVLDVELGRSSAAARRAERIDIGAVQSVPRRCRLMIEASRGYLLRREHAGALHLLRRAYQTSPEATRYSMHARGLAHDLVAKVGPMLRPDAERVARDLGVVVD